MELFDSTPSAVRLLGMAKNTGDDSRLIIPGANWLTVKKVIRGYGAATGDDPSGEEIATLSGLQRTVVSTCNKFLRMAGVVQSEKNLLTEVGARLVTAWDIENQPMAAEALEEIIMSSSPLARLVGIARARGSMNPDLFKGQIIAAAGLKGDSFLIPYVKTIVDMLDESKLIQVSEDAIAPGRPAANGGGAKRQEQEKVSGEGKLVHRTDSNGSERDNEGRTRTPLPFGPSRLGYIELPKDWEQKELPKLLKMLELILGGEN